jgi:hypothetical protein
LSHGDKLPTHEPLGDTLKPWQGVSGRNVNWLDQGHEACEWLSQITKPCHKISWIWCRDSISTQREWEEAEWKRVATQRDTLVKVRVAGSSQVY